MPYAHVALITALEEYLEAPQTIVLRGDGAALQEWQTNCARPYAPGRIVLAIPSGETDLPGLLAERRAQGEVIAYVCQGMTCQAPVSSLAELQALL